MAPTTQPDQGSRELEGDVAGSLANPFSGPGDMRECCRALDWSVTPLMAVDNRPVSLRTAVQMALVQQFPTIILWGPELTQLYNDGYRELMGERHPEAFGQPAAACWPEVWHINAPIYERVWRGEAFAFEDARGRQGAGAWLRRAPRPRAALRNARCGGRDDRPPGAVRWIDLCDLFLRGDTFRQGRLRETSAFCSTCSRTPSSSPQRAERYVSNAWRGRIP